MPNHVINRITFDCSEERLMQILSEICYDDSAEDEDTGIGTIDFNKITPMPPSLDIEEGSSTNYGINLYLTSINPNVKYFGDEKMNPQEFEALAERLNRHRHFLFYKTALSQDEIADCARYGSADELIRLGKIAVENLMNHGAATWYDWRTLSDTWNTKWNSYGSSYSGGSEICFQTAWAAPFPIVRKLSVMYPDVVISHSWADEDLSQNCGKEVWLSGEQIDWDKPETEREFYEFAANVWGYDLEMDCGLVLDESGTHYVFKEDDDPRS